MRTIAAALRTADSGDHIILAETEQPYRESISLVGRRHGGSTENPFVLEGNGAVLDGSADVPAAAWEHHEENVFRFRPPRMGPQQLFLDDRPAERVVAKSGGLYNTASWDLVDASKDETFDIEKIALSDLPATMQKMTPAERKSYVKKLAARRTEIQKQILDLSAKRQAHIRKEMERKGLSEKDSFDAALRNAVRQQAQDMGFEFESGGNSPQAPRSETNTTPAQ